MKYEDMSNFEINKEVTIAMIKSNKKIEIKSIEFDYIQRVIWVETIGFSSCEIKDYCANPSDIMPIAIENGFCIEIPDDNLGGVGAITKHIPNDTDIKVDYEDKNETYRAIAICFLKMMDAK